MKERELREAATCIVCDKKFGHTGMPMFFRLRIERHFLKHEAIRRQQGLESMIGAQLGMALGPDEDLTESSIKGEFTVCYECIVKPVVLSDIVEKMEETKGDDNE